jgi:hypothetical protein
MREATKSERRAERRAPLRGAGIVTRGYALASPDDPYKLASGFAPPLGLILVELGLLLRR